MPQVYQTLNGAVYYFLLIAKMVYNFQDIVFMSPPMADGNIAFTLSGRACVCVCAHADVCVTKIVSGP